MRKITLLLLIMTILTVSVVHAQDDPNAECSFQPTYEVLLNLMQEVNSWESLERFNRDLAASLAFCRGLRFSGTGDEVLGPMNIPAGIYTIGLTGDTTAAAGEMLAGHCDIVFLFTEGGAASTEEGFRSDGCSQLITIDSSTSWTLQFAPVETFEIVTPEEATLAFEAFFDGNLPITNQYFCPQSYLNQGHVDALTARYQDPDISCSYDEFVMTCSVDSGEEDVPPEPIAEMAIEGGLLCDVHFVE